MKEVELKELRDTFNFETKRKRKLFDLIDNEAIQEYLTLELMDKTDKYDERKILFDILNKVKITETNGIYVCIGTFRKGNIFGESDRLFGEKIDFDSCERRFRAYLDIEDGYMKVAYCDGITVNDTIDDFEMNNTVLNPYNSNEFNNGYDDVRYDFFKTAIKEGQPCAKKLVLDKYKRM